jgi:hypothetical protein
MIKACIDKTLDGNEPRKYTHSNNDNVRRSAGPNPRMAVVREKLWDIGANIRVKFLNGESSVQKKVQNYATQWMNYANINLIFVPSTNKEQAEIRISFDRVGSWSYIGRDALDIPQNEPTMNYGWLTKESDDKEYSRVVLHEFGHALGAIHEHQNPAAGIPWNKETVYKYYMGPPNNWSKEKIDNNLFRRYSKNITNFSNFDSDSIMLYPIPAQFTTDGIAIGGRNSRLSKIDIQFMKQQYPKVV